MSTLQMLDVLIGIIFIYLLLSFICSAISEMLEGILKKRASDLEAGIRELLQSTDNTLLEKFYRHPLIASLYKGGYNSKSVKNLPSYIPSRNFALALLDIVMPASSSNLSGAAGGGVISTATVDVTGTTPVLTQPKALEPLREAVLQWKESNAQQAILALIDAAGDDIDAVRFNIESWYNNSMDRVAGWYKRRVHRILLLLGSILAVALNADTIAILKSLTNDPTLRNSLVAVSQEYAKNSPGDSINNRPQDRINNNLKQLQDLRLPIGWNWRTPAQRNENENYRSNDHLAIPSGLGWGTKIIGWLITGLAVSLGAPFWFDLLNKMMVVRSTVKPHEKSPEEASEDRQKKK